MGERKNYPVPQVSGLGVPVLKGFSNLAQNMLGLTVQPMKILLYQIVRVVRLSNSCQPKRLERSARLRPVYYCLIPAGTFNEYPQPAPAYLIGRAGIPSTEKEEQGNSIKYDGGPFPLRAIRGLLPYSDVHLVALLRCHIGQFRDLA